MTKKIYTRRNISTSTSVPLDVPLPVSTVPISEAEKLSENLGVESELVNNAGHFNEKAGYIKFDLLLDGIKCELTAID